MIELLHRLKQEFFFNKKSAETRKLFLLEKEGWKLTDSFWDGSICLVYVLPIHKHFRLWVKLEPLREKSKYFASCELQMSLGWEELKPKYLVVGASGGYGIGSLWEVKYFVHQCVMQAQDEIDRLFKRELLDYQDSLFFELHPSTDRREYELNMERTLPND